MLVVLLSGCATYGDWVGQMEDRIARQDPQAALQVLEQQGSERGRDAALMLLNRAMLLRMQGELAASTAAFEEAKAVIDDLLAISVTEQVGALAISDAQRSYIGDPFERVMLHVYAALNFLESGDTAGARVEVLQLDVLLTALEQDKVPVAEGLARWLSGMIFEALGERSDAMIAYRKAWEAYRRYPEHYAVNPPRALGRDLVRLSAQLGLADEEARFRAAFGIDVQTPRPESGDAEVIFLLHSGLAPVKREGGIVAPTAQGRLVSVSMPYLQSRAPWVMRAELEAGEAVAEAELAENIDALAVATLERRAPAILARAVARAAVKHEASRAVSRENELVGFMVNIAGVVTERADTRNWSTLPNRILVARLPLPAGEHVLGVVLRDRAGGIDTHHTYRVTLSAGDRHFISLHQVSRQDLNPVSRSGRAR